MRPRANKPPTSIQVTAIAYQRRQRQQQQHQLVH